MRERGAEVRNKGCFRGRWFTAGIVDDMQLLANHARFAGQVACSYDDVHVPPMTPQHGVF